MVIDITGIDRARLVKALWMNAGGSILPIFPPFSDEQAAQMGVQPLWYVCGRSMKCDLRSNSVDPERYDLEAGEGKFEQVVRSLKSQCT